MIKNKLILFVIFFLFLLPNAVCCSQESGYARKFTNWFASKVHQYFGPKPELTDKFWKSTYNYLPSLKTTKVLFLINPIGATLAFMLATPIFLMTTCVTLTTDLLILHAQGQIDLETAIQTEEGYLGQLIAQKSIYPTRSSQINALVKKDEFINYVDDQFGIVSEASSRLLDKLLDPKITPVLSQAEKDREAEIDTYVSKLKSKIALLSLQEQIAQLESIQTESRTENKAVGYLSLLNRIRNKFEVENKLIPREKGSLNAWREAASRARSEGLRKIIESWQNVKTKPTIIAPEHP